jgi:hypothetical protein
LRRALRRGFRRTRAQARRAGTEAGSDPPRHCEVVSSHISKKGLFDQLTSEYGEGFAKQDVTFALNHVKADYNAEAREAAESYLDSGHFSHNSLMDQLTSEYGEQFTKAQAAQAVESVGL